MYIQSIYVEVYKYSLLAILHRCRKYGSRPDTVCSWGGHWRLLIPLNTTKHQCLSSPQCRPSDTATVPMPVPVRDPAYSKKSSGRLRSFQRYLL